MPSLLKGVVKEVSAGQIKVRARNGNVFTYQTDDRFRYAQKVIIFFDYHRLRVVRIVSEDEFRKLLYKPDEPEHDPDETTVEVEESESESSLPQDVGSGVPEFEDSDSESESSFQLFEGEFGVFSDEPY